MTAQPPSGRPAGLDAEWFDDADSPLPSRTDAQAGLPKVACTKADRALKRRHQFRIAIALLVVYAAANAALMVGWMLRVPDLELMAAAVGNIGTLVGAVVAYYFATSGRDS